MKNKIFFFCALSATLLFGSCKKETTTVESASIEDYSPFRVGKYITYQLDSTVTINLGASLETRRYIVKYVVDAEITDANNRASYRIVRYMQNSVTGSWSSDATFMATPASNKLEFVENNMRFIKLQLPITNGYTWSGNSHIETSSINSNVQYLADWDYTYDSVGIASTIGTYNLEDVIKIDQRDELIGDPGDPNRYTEINFGMEKYARGIGLVYRKFIHTEYQPQTPSSLGYFTEGSYGVEYTMIDHN